MARKIEIKRTTRSLRRAATIEDRRVTKCRNKFLRYFPGGFSDPTYHEWERNYKVEAHQRWLADLDRAQFRKMLALGEYRELAQQAIRIEGRTNLLFSFEKMAIRDAVRTEEGARDFAIGLGELLYERGAIETRLAKWIRVLGTLPRKATRVVTWPLVTVFPFIAQPHKHIFLKPTVTRRAARAYGYEFEYHSRPGWPTYSSLLGFAQKIAHDVADLEPRDMIDLQSFIWVLGSDEYP